jgi:SAM-dependent methyltransferase
MIDDVSDIRDLYDRGPEVEAERLTRHQLEHDLTWRILEDYLPDQARLLEVGAGTGRYTVELLRRGHDVIAVDLSSGALGLAREAVERAGLADRAKFQVADARALGSIEGAPFDCVLLMGPLYHLVIEQDRRQALRQVRALLADDGVLFSAWISRFGILGDLMRQIPDWILRHDEVSSVVTEGRDPPTMPKGGFRGYFATVEEIEPLHESEGFDTLRLAAVEPFIGPYDECYNDLQGAQRPAWLDLAHRLCSERSIVGASRHLLYVGRKQR